MHTKEIIDVIRRLPFNEQQEIADFIMGSIVENDEKQKIKTAAIKLYDDYTYDEELTTFTVLDSEEFYEAAK